VVTVPDLYRLDAGKIIQSMRRRDLTPLFLLTRSQDWAPPSAAIRRRLLLEVRDLKQNSISPLQLPLSGSRL